MSLSKTLFSLACLLGTAAAPAQSPSLSTTGTAEGSPITSPPVAYVYVASNYSTSHNRLVAYSAAANGRLTPIPGSPFPGDVGPMAVNGKYLFGLSTSPAYYYGTNIVSFSIASNGAVKQVQSVNPQPKGCTQQASLASLVLDHTGSILYDQAYCDYALFYQSLSIDKPTGRLNYLAEEPGKVPSDQLSFAANNIYAYNASPDAINGFQRQSNGVLKSISINAPLPNPEQGTTYSPNHVAADPTNHLAVFLQVNGSERQSYPGQLATYTIDSSGHLSTRSDYQNMPKVPLGSVYDLSMSPSGKLLAVAGAGGLLVYHFNGASPITKYTGPLTTTAISHVFWDNKNHLYALSFDTAYKLYVFTVTPTSASQAPGSPYSVYRPEALIVQPK